jgi:hypothetical protein
VGDLFPHAAARSQADRPSTSWRMLAAIDLHGCDRAAAADPDTIRAFVRALAGALGLGAGGPLRLERYADAEAAGWSAIERVEQPAFSVRVGTVGAQRFADVFASRPFDARVAGAVAGEHFGGTPSVRVLRR